MLLAVGKEHVSTSTAAKLSSPQTQFSLDVSSLVDAASCLMTTFLKNKKRFH